MRVDIVTIFPTFFDVLGVSLIGKARDRGILDMHVHDLRDWTHDRHRTVDDTRYGGGAGMVMKPEPWGEALDAVAPAGAVLVVPSPAATRLEVRELSVGDYVLNGGEVAALAMIEAVVRLLPGFMGNAGSLEEESHSAGLLEYPVYTQPAAWRGHEVPEV